MLLVRLRRALEPAEMAETSCALCGARFLPGSVLADVVTREGLGDIGGDFACPACVEYLHRRNPQQFPSLEELEEARRQHPEPVFSSVEEATELSGEDAATFGAAVDASWLARA